MRVKSFSGIIMRIAVILLCLVLFSAHLASGMFARYTMSASDSGEGRVAKAGVEILPGDGFTPDGTGNIPVNVTPSGAATYRFKVKNISEFPVKYDILISFQDCYTTDTHELARSVDGTYTDLKLDGNSEDVFDDGRYIFSDKGTLAPNTTSEEYTMTMQLNYTSISPGTASGIVINRQYRMPIVILARATQIG